MKPLELITLGLTRRTKIVLTYKDWSDKTKTVTCFFGGYRNFMCQGRIDNEYDLVPLFYEMGKNGKMRNKRLEDAPYAVENIVNISILEAKPRLYANEKDDLYMAYRNLDKRAYDLIKGIVTEICGLYPGKKILFGEYINGGYISYKHGADFANLTAIYLNTKGELAVDYNTNDNSVEGEEYDELDIDNTAMLSTLCAAISEPSLEDEDQMQVNFVNPKTTKWDEIPANNIKAYPTVSRLNLFNLLSANLWYNSLDDEKKKEIKERNNVPWNEMTDNIKISCHQRNI